MPARQPVTTLCQTLSRSRNSGRADLHLHSVHSDGTYTPTEVLDLARRSGLAAIALTDHDTLSGVALAQAEARGAGVEVIPGVEITAEFRGRELHLLGYFVRIGDTALCAALDRLRHDRVGRFRGMVERLRGCGVSIEESEWDGLAEKGTLGRRHLAALLVKARRAGSVREAFSRYLADDGRVALPKLRLPVREAIELVRAAGGVAAWAHPSYDCTLERLSLLRNAGLGAVEAEYPSHRNSRVRELRAFAGSLGLAISGGSDCHGPDQSARAIGACSISGDELAALRALAVR